MPKKQLLENNLNLTAIYRLLLKFITLLLIYLFLIITFWIICVFLAIHFQASGRITTLVFCWNIFLLSLVTRYLRIEEGEQLDRRPQ